MLNSAFDLNMSPLPPAPCSCTNQTFTVQAKSVAGKKRTCYSHMEMAKINQGSPPIAEEREQSVSHHCMSYNTDICLGPLDTQRVAGPGQTH